MALRIDLDYALQIVSEPGYWQGPKSRQIGKEMIAVNQASHQAFWRDPAFTVIMKKPLQMDGKWLNTADQVTSIIGLTDHGAGVFVPFASDTTNNALHEQPVHQNADNPWIHHAPITPSIAAPVGLTGHGGQGSVVTLAEVAEVNIPATAGSPDVDSSDVKCIAYTQDDLRWNQPLFLRWFNPPALIGHTTAYGFMIGQYCVFCHDSLCEVFLDISEGKDRSLWRRVLTKALFSSGAVSPISNVGPIGTAFPVEETAGERSLLWLPYRRHDILLISDKGQHAIVRTLPFPELNGEPEGLERDWKIVEPRKLSVWGLTRGGGRFQVQKVKFISGSHSFRIKPFVIDYTPAAPLDANSVVSKHDEYRGTSVSHAVPVTPPGYTVPENELDTCPEPTTGPGDQSRTYGFHFTMEASADGQFTPFFYGYEIRVPRVVGVWAQTPKTISDNAPDGLARIERAEFTSSDRRGESELTVDILDFPNFPAATHYFRSAEPVHLYESTGPTSLFVGIADPTEVNPLRVDLNILRRMTVKAHDLWKILEDSYLRDQRDWGPTETEQGKGHIFVVDFIARQAGVDTTGADYPPGGIGGAFDWPLGGGKITIDTQTGAVNPGWKPSDRPPDTAASFIERIASLFSGWDVGFYPNGQFFYRPKDLYTASEVTFQNNRVSGSPLFRSPVEYRHEEPELNVFQLEASDPNGNPLVSSRWVDRASIVNVSAPNFLGRWRAGYAKIDGAFTCDQLNHMARIIWNAARRRHLLIRFEAEYHQSLRIGRCCTLQGYGGRWRIRNYNVEYVRTGWSPATYEAELVERGFL